MGCKVGCIARSGGKLFDSPGLFLARYGLAISGTRFEDHPPYSPRFIGVAALFGQHGEVAQGQMAVDALIDAAETVGTPQRQDPPPAGFGLGRLASFAMQYGLAEMQLGVIESG